MLRIQYGNLSVDVGGDSLHKKRKIFGVLMWKVAFNLVMTELPVNTACLHSLTDCNFQLQHIQ